MRERLMAYDWTDHARHEPRAGRMPRLLLRYLLGDPSESRRACRAVWLVLAGDDGYIGSEGLVALTAVALLEALPDLDAEGRRRAARLLHHTAHDMWLNIYGEPGEAVVAALRQHLGAIHGLLNEEEPDTVGLAARLLRKLGVRSPEAARRALAVFDREHHPGRRCRLVAALAYHGGPDLFGFLIDETANDPEPVVRWRAALALACRLKRRTADQEAEVLKRVLLGPREQERMMKQVPALGHVEGRTFRAVLLLPRRHAIPALLGLLRRGDRGCGQAVAPLLQRTGPWPTGPGPRPPLNPQQREVVAALADCRELDPPSHPALGNPLLDLLGQAGLPKSREGLRDLAANG
jgi:hypothetical protein